MNDFALSMTDLFPKNKNYSCYFKVFMSMCIEIKNCYRLLYLKYSPQRKPGLRYAVGRILPPPVTHPVCTSGLLTYPTYFYFGLEL